MPDFWTHLIAGEEISQSITRKNLKELIEKNYQLFNFACQGADILFYHKFLPWQQSSSSKKADLIHNLSGRKLFGAVLSEYKKERVYLSGQLPDSLYWQQNLVYLAGFISHFALDKECHPYIQKNGGAGADHKLIEMSIDVYLMNKKWNQHSKKVDPRPYYQLKDDYKKSLNYFYQLIFNNLLKTELASDLVWDSYQDLEKFHSIFFSTNSKKYYLLKFLNYIFPQNLSQYNYALSEKEAVWSQKNYQEFELKYENGVELAQILIEKTLLYLESKISLSQLLEYFGDQNFLGEKTS